MKPTALPLFEGFIETPFEQRFQGLLRQAWRSRRWHVIVAEPGSGKTMGIRDLSAQAARERAATYELGLTLASLSELFPEDASASGWASESFEILSELGVEQRVELADIATEGAAVTLL